MHGRTVVLKANDDTALALSHGRPSARWKLNVFKITLPCSGRQGRSGGRFEHVQ